jgi:hypothetical protein
MRRLVLVGLLVFSITGSATADEAGVCADAAENGQKVRDKGQYSEAKELFTKCARKQCPKHIRDDCMGFLDQLRKRQPSIVIRVTDSAKHDVTAFRILKDNKLLLDKPSGTAIDVDPGEAKLHVEADGYKPRDLPVVVAEGEQRRLVEIELHPVSEPEPKPIAPIPGPAAPIEYTSSPRAPAIVSGVVGVAGFGVLALFQGLVASQHTYLENHCLPTSPGGKAGDCTSVVHSADTKYAIGTVGFGVGVAGVGTALIVYFVSDYHRPKTSSPQSGRFIGNGFTF